MGNFKARWRDAVLTAATSTKLSSSAMKRLVSSFPFGPRAPRSLRVT
jgi:hypothetical protein